MNESPRQTPDADTSKPLGGERLALARRKNEMSVREIAKELHLDEPTILALEQNNFALLGAPVFAKGHLRKYAEFVGVPVDEILSDYYQLNRSTGAPPIVGPVRKTERAITPGLWIAATVVLVIGVIAAYWWFARESAPPLSQPDSGVLAPFTSEAGDVPAQEPAGVAADIVSGAEPATGAGELPARETAVASSALPVNATVPVFEEASLLPQVRIELSFSGDCWTEVSDASGRRLFYDLGTAGRVVALSGDEPLRVVLGASENVSITMEGRDYPLPGPARNGGLNRLTINSQ